jgi:3-oxoacyl-[acyl-carrier-protein] synthase-3
MATIIDDVHTQLETRQLRPSDYRSLTGVQILGVGSCVPNQVVTNQDLAALGYDADWIIQRTGVSERRCAGADTATSDLAYGASLACLQRAGVSVDEIDLILLATVTPDNRVPSTACRLQVMLGATAPSMDINAACSGFLFGLTTGMQFIKSGGARNVLVVAADVISRVANPADKKTYPLFGDAAGAVLLGPGRPDQGMVSYTLGSDGRGLDLLWIPAGGSREPITHESLEANRQFIHMEGRTVFKWAVRQVSDTIRGALEHARLNIEDVRTVVLHQANVRIIDAIAQELGIDPDRLIINVNRYGNTSAASVPLALDDALLAGRVQRGDLVLLCGFGAGLTWGTALVRW